MRSKLLHYSAILFLSFSFSTCIPEPFVQNSTEYMKNFNSTFKWIFLNAHSCSTGMYMEDNKMVYYSNIYYYNENRSEYYLHKYQEINNITESVHMIKVFEDKCDTYKYKWKTDGSGMVTSADKINCKSGLIVESYEYEFEPLIESNSIYDSDVYRPTIIYLYNDRRKLTEQWVFTHYEFNFFKVDFYDNNMVLIKSVEFDKR